jgi:hypothetical protein
MAQLTAMEKLIHNFKHGKFNKLTNSQIDKELERYLVKEKEQLENCYDYGTLSLLDGNGHGDSFEDYYNKTFKNKL